MVHTNPRSCIVTKLMNINGTGAKFGTLQSAFCPKRHKFTGHRQLSRRCDGTFFSRAMTFRFNDIKMTRVPLSANHYYGLYKPNIVQYDSAGVDQVNWRKIRNLSMCFVPRMPKGLTGVHTNNVLSAILFLLFTLLSRVLLGTGNGALDFR